MRENTVNLLTSRLRIYSASSLTKSQYLQFFTPKKIFNTTQRRAITKTSFGVWFIVIDGYLLSSHTEFISTFLQKVRILIKKSVDAFSNLPYLYTLKNTLLHRYFMSLFTERKRFSRPIKNTKHLWSPFWFRCWVL